MPQVSLNFGIRHVGLRLFVLQAYENILCFSVSHIYVMQAALLSANSILWNCYDDGRKGGSR